MAETITANSEIKIFILFDNHTSLSLPLEFDKAEPLIRKVIAEDPYIMLNSRHPLAPKKTLACSFDTIDKFMEDVSEWYKTLAENIQNHATNYVI